MRFEPGQLVGLWIIEAERVADERGYFARTWSVEEFAAHGIACDFRQDCVSYNAKRATLRGMHFQHPPFAEAKLIRCSRGAVYDVLLDLRKESGTYLQWQAIELTERNLLAVFAPEGLAHGFQTLEDHSEVTYKLSSSYAPQYADGVRWNDPAFGIEWPEAEARIISERDHLWPDYGAS